MSGEPPSGSGSGSRYGSRSSTGSKSGSRSTSGSGPVSQEPVSGSGTRLNIWSHENSNNLSCFLYFQPENSSKRAKNQLSSLPLSLPRPLHGRLIMFHADGRPLSIPQLRRDFVSSIMTGREKEEK